MIDEMHARGFLSSLSDSRRPDMELGGASGEGEDGHKISNQPNWRVAHTISASAANHVNIFLVGRTINWPSTRLSPFVSASCLALPSLPWPQMWRGEGNEPERKRGLSSTSARSLVAYLLCWASGSRAGASLAARDTAKWLLRANLLAGRAGSLIPPTANSEARRGEGDSENVDLVAAEFGRRHSATGRRGGGVTPSACQLSWSFNFSLCSPPSSSSHARPRINWLMCH